MKIIYTTGWSKKYLSKHVNILNPRWIPTVVIKHFLEFISPNKSMISGSFLSNISRYPIRGRQRFPWSWEKRLRKRGQLTKISIVRRIEADTYMEGSSLCKMPCMEKISDFFWMASTYWVVACGTTERGKENIFSDVRMRTTQRQSLAEDVNL